jgi:hypothetical protein
MQIGMSDRVIRYVGYSVNEGEVTPHATRNKKFMIWAENPFSAEYKIVATPRAMTKVDAYRWFLGLRTVHGKPMLKAAREKIGQTLANLEKRHERAKASAPKRRPAKKKKLATATRKHLARPSTKRNEAPATETKAAA